MENSRRVHINDINLFLLFPEVNLIEVVINTLSYKISTVQIKIIGNKSIFEIRPNILMRPKTQFATADSSFSGNLGG